MRRNIKNPKIAIVMKAVLMQGRKLATCNIRARTIAVNKRARFPNDNNRTKEIEFSAACRRRDDTVCRTGTGTGLGDKLSPFVL